MAGQHVIVYSDAASDPMKRHLAEIADDEFERILALFDFQQPADLRYPPGYSSIDIYLTPPHPETVNWAYLAGFIITIRSSEISGHWQGYTVYTVRHELTHEFEFLIEGRGGLGTDVWSREGLAVTYLLDEAGMGRPYGDVLALFYDVRAGRPFPDSFEDRFGISLSAFEGEFFHRVRTYLSANP